jgi:hypothetical protein
MKFLFTLVTLAVITTPAAAADCIVNDPTGTPLNVRAVPNGPIRGALHNGTPVTILDSTIVGGKQWTLVAPRIGKTGWVFDSFLVCS